MNDDPNTTERIRALKASTDAPTIATAKIIPPVDVNRLLPLLVDSIAEQRRTNKVLQQSVIDLTNLVLRWQQDLPAACTKASQDEIRLILSQLAVIVPNLELLGKHTIQASAKSEDCAGTLRVFCKLLAVATITVVATAIYGRYK